jgi:hypothetical protein
MKKLRFFLLFGLLAFPLSSCASMWSITKNAVWPSSAVIPSPQAGLVLPINRSPGVWAECRLFEGNLGRAADIIVPGRGKGNLTFVKDPLKHFVINPPVSQPYRNNAISTAITVPLLMPAYPADYTLLVFHQNFLGTVVEIEVKRFSTTGYAFNDHYLSGNRKIYADKVIKLARVKPYQNQQFRFHRTYYPGHALKDALGLP